MRLSSFLLPAALAAPALIVVLAAGCKGSRGGSATAEATAAPSTQPSKRETAKRNACPTGVIGASASATDTKDGVALTIVAKGDLARQEIGERSHALAQAAAPGASGGGGGDGNGSGDGTGGGGGSGGGMGRCPVVLRAVALDVRDTQDGALVTMRPTAESDLQSLRSQVRKRLAEL